MMWGRCCRHSRSLFSALSFALSLTLPLTSPALSSSPPPSGLLSGPSPSPVPWLARFNRQVAFQSFQSSAHPPSPMACTQQAMCDARRAAIVGFTYRYEVACRAMRSASISIARCESLTILGGCRPNSEAEATVPNSYASSVTGSSASATNSSVCSSWVDRATRLVIDTSTGPASKPRSTVRSLPPATTLPPMCVTCSR